MNGQPWTEHDIETVRALYPDHSAKDISLIVDRGIGSIYSMAKKLGVKKSEAFLKSAKSGRLTGEQGKSGRFEQSHQPWNKGKSYTAGGRSAETRFKKGQKPASWKPIGSERLQDGYLQRKMTDTGYTPGDWVPVHRLIWEEHNGPITPGYVLVFKNGNKQDIEIENLEMISRGDLVRRNSIHNYPKELADVMRLQGQVKRQIRKREKTNNEK